MTTTTRLLAAVVALAAAALALAFAPVASAKTLTVTSAEDGAPGSLRALIASAADFDTIEVPDPRTLTPPAEKYLLGSQLEIVDRRLVIRGAGARRVVLDAGGNGRVLRVARTNSGDPTYVEVSGVTIRGGRVTSPSEPYGGGVALTGTNARLVLTETAVVDNVVDVPGSAGFGGGVAALGFVDIARSLVARNTVHSNAGAGGATSYGGGIWSTATNSFGESTITGNAVLGTDATVAGGGVAATGSGHLTLTRVTVAGNSALSPAGATGGNLTHAGIESTSLSGAIVAGGSATDPAQADCSGSVSDIRGNVFSAAAGCTVSAMSGSIVADPRFDDALRDNGGPTDTWRLLPDSPAIGRLVAPFCAGAATDQRGVPRNSTMACAAGAYEPAAPALTDVEASGVTGEAATVTGSLDPRGPGGTARVVHGTDAASLTSSTAPVAYDTGTAPAPVAVPVGGLEPNRTYFARLVATGPDGATESDVFSFTTRKVAPAAVTGEATSVGTESAVLRGTVDPRGAAATYRFEFGPSEAALVPLAERLAGSGRGSVEQSETVAQLEPDTEYAFRIVAVGEAGETAGEIRRFRTRSSVTEPTPTPTASPTPSASPAPTATATPAPTATPTPAPLTLRGLKVTPSVLGRRFKRARFTYTLAGGTGATVAVRFRVEQVLVGRRSGSRCVKAPRRGRFVRCRRVVTLRGSLATSGRPGANTFVWTGRLSGRRPAKGSYRLVARAAGAPVVRVAFRVR